MWVFLLLAAYYLYQKIDAGKRLDVSFEFPQNVRVERGQVLFIQPVTLVNFTQTKLTVQSIVLDFSTEQGSYIGRAILPSDYYLLPGNAQVTLSLNVVANLGDLVRAIPNVVAQVGQQKIAVRYEGYIGAEFVQIPVNEVFTIDRAYFNL